MPASSAPSSRVRENPDSMSMSSRFDMPNDIGEAPTNHQRRVIYRATRNLSGTRRQMKGGERTAQWQLGPSAGQPKLEPSADFIRHKGRLPHHQTRSTGRALPSSYLVRGTGGFRMRLVWSDYPQLTAELSGLLTNDK